MKKIFKQLMSHGNSQTFDHVFRTHFVLENKDTKEIGRWRKLSGGKATTEHWNCGNLQP